MQRKKNRITPMWIIGVINVLLPWKKYFLLVQQPFLTPTAIQKITVHR